MSTIATRTGGTQPICVAHDIDWHWDGHTDDPSTAGITAFPGTAAPAVSLQRLTRAHGRGHDCAHDTQALQTALGRALAGRDRALLAHLSHGYLDALHHGRPIAHGISEWLDGAGVLTAPCYAVDHDTDDGRRMLAERIHDDAPIDALAFRLDDEPALVGLLGRMAIGLERLVERPHTGDAGRPACEPIELDCRAVPARLGARRLPDATEDDGRTRVSCGEVVLYPEGFRLVLEVDVATGHVHGPRRLIEATPLMDYARLPVLGRLVVPPR